MGAPCEATIALTLGQVVAFNQAGVDGGAGWRCGQLLRKRLQITADHFAGHLHDTTMVSRLHDLGRQPLWRRHAPWFGITASIAVAWRVRPHAIGMHQRLPILGSWIAGEEWHRRIGDVQDTLEKQIGALGRALTDHEGPPEPPPRGTGAPPPRITRGRFVESSKRPGVLRGMPKAPECVQLACDALEVSPQVQHHQAAVLGCSSQPGTSSLLVDLDDAGRRADCIAFRSCPHRRLTNRWVCVQVQAGCPISDRYRRCVSPA
jgi:hypothetical protein